MDKFWPTGWDDVNQVCAELCTFRGLMVEKKTQTIELNHHYSSHHWGWIPDGLACCFILLGED